MLLTIRTNIGTLSLFLFQVVSQSFQPFSQPHEAESLLTQGSYPSHPTLTHTQSNPTLCSRSVSPTPVNPNDNASTSLPHETNFTGQMEFLTGPNQYQRPLPPASSEESISDSQFSDEGQFNPLNMDHAISGSPYTNFLVLTIFKSLCHLCHLCSGWLVSVYLTELTCPCNGIPNPDVGWEREICCMILLEG